MIEENAVEELKDCIKEATSEIAYKKLLIRKERRALYKTAFLTPVTSYVGYLIVCDLESNFASKFPLIPILLACIGGLTFISIIPSYNKKKNELEEEMRKIEKNLETDQRALERQRKFQKGIFLEKSDKVIDLEQKTVEYLYNVRKEIQNQMGNKLESVTKTKKRIFKQKTF